MHQDHCSIQQGDVMVRLSSLGPYARTLHVQPHLNTSQNVYVSWNGDTETASWRFYAVTDGYGSRDFLGEVKRTSFETSLGTSKDITSVAAEAVDVHGRVIGSTASVVVEAEVLPAQLDDAKGQEPLGRYDALGADL